MRYSSSRGLAGIHASPSEDRLLQLKDQLLQCPKGRPVFVNGCFEVLHEGHKRLFAKALSFDRPVVVALNSADYLRRVKARFDPRSFQLRAESIVRFFPGVHVLEFDDREPSRLISLLAPDVVVKGPDYIDRRLPEALAIRSVAADLLFCGDHKTQSASDLLGESMRQEQLQALRLEKL